MRTGQAFLVAALTAAACAAPASDIVHDVEQRILLDQRHINKIVNWLYLEGELSDTEIGRVFPSEPELNPWTLTGVVHHVPGHDHHVHVRVHDPGDL